MSIVNLGKIAFTWKGAYSGAASYNKQDVVSYNGDAYVCVNDAGIVGVTPVSTGTNWNLFAQGTLSVSSSAGEVIYNNGTGLVALPAGTNGQVLSINASGLPVWSTPDIRSGTKVKKLMTTIDQPNVYRRGFAIMTDNSLRAWGYNGAYNLGDGTTYSRSYPIRVAFPPGFVGAAEMFAGNEYGQYCIDTAGKLWGWGNNGNGNMGIGNTTNQQVPVCISNVATTSIYGKTVTNVCTPGGTQEANSVLVLCSDGTIHAAGYNGYGQCGSAAGGYVTTMTRVGTLTGVTDIAACREQYTTYFAVASGVLYSWGYNGDGELGNGTTDGAVHATPTAMTGGSLSGKTIVKVQGGYLSAFAIDSTGALHAWGTNQYGCMGTGNTANAFTPVQVATNVADVIPSTYDYPITLIRKTDNTVWAVGYGGYTANGDASSTSTNSFVKINLPTTINSVAVTPTKVLRGGTGSYNWCAVLMSNGMVYTWGYNGYGQCGVGHVNTVTAPTQVLTGNRIVSDISSFGQSNEGVLMLLLDDGSLLLNGYDGDYGVTEDRGNYVSVPTPVIF